MKGSIKIRLVAGFLCVVAVFAAGAWVAGINAYRASGNVRAFLDRNWPTADLLMEGGVLLNEVAAEIMNPPLDVPPQQVIDQAQGRLEDLQRRLPDADLGPDVVNRLGARLEKVRGALASPVTLFRLPGERMEEADAAAHPLLDKLAELGEVSLINTTWEAIMSFNDILITRDQAEKSNFLVHTALIEGHPGFGTFRQPYAQFKEKATSVFDAAIELEGAQKGFQEAVKAAALDFKEVAVEYHGGVVTPASARTSNSLRLILQVMLAATIVSAAFSILIGFYFARGISNPIRRVMHVFGEMEQGNLGGRIRLQRNDEIGQMANAVDQMADKLSGMVGRVRTSADDLVQLFGKLAASSATVEATARSEAEAMEKASGAMLRIRSLGDDIGNGVNHLMASATAGTSSVLEMSSNIEEIAVAAEGLARSVDEVTSSIQEMAAAIVQISESVRSLKEASDATASSVVQMDASIAQVEENARKTRQITDEVRGDAERGESTVEATIRGIKDIRREAQVSGEVISALAAKAGDIEKIIQVIVEVTEQTNMLALNASIISAQAGENGRAFGVVAEEIRALAQRTGASTREITDVIRGVQEDIGRAVESIRKTETQVHEGENLSRASGEALAKIVAGVTEAAGQVDRIAGATAEQARGSGRIRSTMEMVARMVGQIATATEEQEKGGRSIRSAAETMREQTAQVSRATREQSDAAKVIARSTEEVREMVQTIDTNCAEQRRHGAEIDAAVADIREGAKNNLAVVDTLRGAVQSLSAQVDALNAEMTRFKV